METDEQFEFIDFSAASGWEKFIKSIEDVLLGWNLGGASPASPPFASPSSSHRAFTSPGNDPEKKQQQHGKNQEDGDERAPSCSGGSGLIPQDTSRGFQLKEVITLEDASYTLSYHYHPAKERMAAGVPKIDLDFLPSSLEGVQHHALHRWTGLTHLLIVSPVTISDIFASTVSPAGSVVIDLSTAKLLMSSFAIAFQNTGCRIPVFVATGQPWNMTFAGLSMQPQATIGHSDTTNMLTIHHLQPPSPSRASRDKQGSGSIGSTHDGLEDLEEDQAIEVRFNTILVPYPPVQYSYLSGLLGFFIERMSIEDTNNTLHAPQESDGDLSRYSHHLKESIHVSALFSYDLLNWYDEDWRRWRVASPPAAVEGADGEEEGVDLHRRPSQDSSSTLDHEGSQQRRRRQRRRRRRSEELADESSSLHLEQLKVEEGKPVRPVPTLPFGPVQDPLKSLRLQARFASAPSTMYLDSRSFTDMDASLANIWIISAAFKDDDYGMLSGILEDALASWTSEIMSSAPSSKMGSEGRGDKQHTYESLLHTGARIIQGTITMVDASDVENIVQALFDTDAISQHGKMIEAGGGKGGAGKRKKKRERITSAALRNPANRTRLITASELGMHFRHGTTVPVDSFLWRMLQHLVDVISPNSDISYATSIMGFLKVLWSEILKQFYLQWENSELVPLIDMYQHDDLLDDIEEDDEEEEEEGQVVAGAAGELEQDEGDSHGLLQDPEKTPTADSKAGGGKKGRVAKKNKKKKTRRPMSIDMRFNLLHQKISMLNCCIARQQEINQETPSNVIPLHRRSHLSPSRQGASSPASTVMSDPTTSASGQHHHPAGGGQFHSLLQGLSEMSRPRSADVVPMAKRLLETAKNKGSEVLSSYAGGGDRSGTQSAVESRVASPLISPTTAPIPVRRASKGSRGRSSRRGQDGLALGESEDDEVFYDSVEGGGGGEGGGDDQPSPSSSLSSTRQPLDQQTHQQQQQQQQYLHPQQDAQRPAFQRQHRSQSIADSFVQLKYSSSAESQSAVLVPSPAHRPSPSSRASGGDSSSGASSTVPGESVVLDPREVQNPEASEGALEPFKELKLLETGAQMMVPKLQEYGFMTEDMIQQQEELFETLGSSSDGAKTRAKMQSSQLVSDMEAFKAANPGCVLGDFIRWHSPKDWDETENKMSARMADSGNYWQELWASAKRIPANRQTPLFNHNQEAAKALFYLDSLSVNQLFVQLLPSICLIAYDTLVSHPVASHVRQVAEHLRDLAQDLTEFGWNELAATSEDKHLDELIERFRQVEILMGRAIALARKFPEQYSLVERFLDETECVVEDGVERESVYDLFSLGGTLSSSFPQPTTREFVLETFDPYSSKVSSPEVTGWHARPLQRRLYACFKESEARLVEAVAKDGMFL